MVTNIEIKKLTNRVTNIEIKNLPIVTNIDSLKNQ
jgi:hypothetical protein